MEIKIANNNYACDEESLHRLYELQDQASEIIQKDLRKPMIALSEKGAYTIQTIACALMRLAYTGLRMHYTAEKTGQVFDVLAHYSKERGEELFAESRKKAN